jgi:uncharacterized membrane protein
VSLLLCLAAVVIFTGHALLFLILFMTILGECNNLFLKCTDSMQRFINIL